MEILLQALDKVVIATIVAMFFSYVLEVVPGANTLWGKVAKKYKSLVVLAACLIVPLAIVGLSCFGIDIGYGAVCPDPSDPMLWITAVILGGWAFVTSQWTFIYGSSTLAERLATLKKAATLIPVEVQAQAVETPANPTPVEGKARSNA